MVIRDDDEAVMLPIFVEANFDKIASIGSYCISAAAFLLTVAALVVTAIGIYISLRQTSALKIVELEQKKFENALELVKIISGVKDNYKDGSNSTFLQIACIESLIVYPHYIELYKYMLRWYERQPES